MPDRFVRQPLTAEEADLLSEKLVAKFPYPDGPTFEHSWGTTRRRDETVIWP
jgi:hypothetical protein